LKNAFSFLVSSITVPRFLKGRDMFILYSFKILSVIVVSVLSVFLASS